MPGSHEDNSCSGASTLTPRPDLLFCCCASGLASQYKQWTAKYGYGRFFPVYVDKSGLSDDTAPAAKASKPVSPAAAVALLFLFLSPLCCGRAAAAGPPSQAKRREGKGRTRLCVVRPVVLPLAYMCVDDGQGC